MQRLNVRRRPKKWAGKGLKMTIRVLSPLVLIACVTTFSGCASFGGKQVVLHPIEKADIQPMKQGQAYTPEKDGFFLSKLYVEEVMNAKVQTVKKTA